jgi:hypothetical protein
MGVFDLADDAAAPVVAVLARLPCVLVGGLLFVLGELDLEKGGLVLVEEAELFCFRIDVGNFELAEAGCGKFEAGVCCF